MNAGALTILRCIYIAVVVRFAHTRQKKREAPFDDSLLDVPKIRQTYFSALGRMSERTSTFFSIMPFSKRKA